MDEKFFKHDVTEALGSVSSDHSKKVSSRLVTVSQRKHRVSLTHLPWKTSCTQVLGAGAVLGLKCENAEIYTHNFLCAGMLV